MAPEEKVKTNAERIEELILETIDEKKLVSLLSDFHPADIAEAIDKVPDDLKDRVINNLDYKTAGEVLDEASYEDVEDFVEDAPVEQLAYIVDNMPPDEAADILEMADEDKVEEVIARLDPDHAGDVRELRSFESETAGGIMTPDFFWVRTTESVGEVIKRIKSGEEDVETLEEIFVVGEGMHLNGVIMVEDFLAADHDTKVGRIMDKAVVVTTADADQEVCARLMKKYDLGVLPVVNEKYEIIGIITVDDILEVMDDEAAEDMYRLVGVGETKPLERGPLVRAAKRLPWLLVTTIGMSLLGIIISQFEVTLSKIVAVSFFIPAIMGLGGNVGIQSATITVRGIATGEIKFKDYFWMLWREMLVALIIGSICALALGAAAFTFLKTGVINGGASTPDPLVFGATVGLALFIGVLASVLLGTSVPMFCEKFKVDPALASGPFVTTLVDIGTQVIYLALATAILLG